MNGDTAAENVRPANCARADTGNSQKVKTACHIRRELAAASWVALESAEYRFCVEHRSTLPCDGGSPPILQIPAHPTAHIQARSGTRMGRQITAMVKPSPDSGKML